MALSETPGIEDFRLLVSIAETGNVSDTAKLFGVSQPSVTKRLQVFRDRDPLVTNGHPIQLTSKGLQVLPSIRELLRQYDQIKACLAAKRDAADVLSLATGSSASQHFLPAAIAQMRIQNSNLEIEVHATRGSTRIAGVCEGRYDLAIVSHDRVQIDLEQSAHRTQSALVIHELAQQPLCVIAAKNSPEAKELSAVLAGQELPIEMLSRWVLVGLDRSSGIRRQIERAFANSPHRLRFSYNAAGWFALKEYVKHGLGVGVLPLGLLTREDSDVLVIRRLPAELCVRYYLVHRQDATNRFIDAMKTALDQAAKHEAEQIRRRWQI